MREVDSKLELSNRRVSVRTRDLFEQESVTMVQDANVRLYPATPKHLREIVMRRMTFQMMSQLYIPPVRMDGYSMSRYVDREEA